MASSSPGTCLADSLRTVRQRISTIKVVAARKHGAERSTTRFGSTTGSACQTYARSRRSAVARVATSSLRRKGTTTRSDLAP